MGIGNRVLNLIKAKVGSFLSTHEDPEAMLNQTIEQMERELIQHKNAIANVGASWLENRDKLATATKEIDVWHQRGVLAMQAGDMALAQHAVMKKQETIALQQSLTNSLAIIAPKFEEYRTRYEDLAAKVSQYKNQKAELTMRVRAAKTEQELDKALAGEFGTAFGQFDELTNRIKQFEYQTRAAAMLNQSFSVSDRAYQRLEVQKFTRQLSQTQQHYLQPAPTTTSRRTVVTTITNEPMTSIPFIPPIRAMEPIPAMPAMDDFEARFKELEMGLIK